MLGFPQRFLDIVIDGMEISNGDFEILMWNIKCYGQ